GLYGGAIADAVDRRKLLLVTSLATMAVSIALLAQAAAGLRSVPLLCGCVAVQAAFAAVDGPARRSLTPVLVRAEKLPAANTLSYGSFTLSVIIGPVLAGVAVAAGGFSWAYGIDVV